jgi:hypothetical protein
VAGREDACGSVRLGRAAPVISRGVTPNTCRPDDRAYVRPTPKFSCGAPTGATP